jgi:hypothetical protein
MVSAGFMISSTNGPVEKPNEEGAVVNRTNLNFGMVTGHDNPPAQTFSVSIDGCPDTLWSVTDNADWLICTPSSGKGPGTVNVSAFGCQLTTGAYTGKITVSDDYDPATPQTIDVDFRLYSPGHSSPPFGSFDTPLDSSTVRSSVPVTGWALDDVGVEDVKIYRGQGGSLTYIGDAGLVEGARPDVERAYPGNPENYKAGWGYMMLTNFLPGGGNGTFTLYAIATDREGNEVTLGSKTVICDNAHAVKPFGAIDSPTQGGTASGDGYINWGWALTPQPKHIPTDGSTINVFVDGVNIGHPHYNNYRKDIAELFPDFSNSEGAVGYFYFDTTGYADGVHTIQWTAADNEGSTDGIGSRYFTIRNTGDDRVGLQAADSSNARRNSARYFHVSQLKDIPIEDTEVTGISTGFDKNTRPGRIGWAENGVFTATIKELERLEIDLSHSMELTGGYLINGQRLQSLPIGSTLDIKNKKYYWQPGPGFTGEYRLVFIFNGDEKTTMRKHMVVKIEPKFKAL